jgi:hypothetical protein
VDRKLRPKERCTELSTFIYYVTNLTDFIDSMNLGEDTTNGKLGRLVRVVESWGRDNDQSSSEASRRAEVKCFQQEPLLRRHPFQTDGRHHR